MCISVTYEAVSPGLARLAVCDHHRLVDVPESLEVLSERRVVGVVRQPAHEDLGKGGVLLNRRRRRVHDVQGSSVHELVQKHLAQPGARERDRGGERGGWRLATRRLDETPSSGFWQRTKTNAPETSENGSRPGDKSARDSCASAARSLALTHQLLLSTKPLPGLEPAPFINHRLSHAYTMRWTNRRAASSLILPPSQRRSAPAFVFFDKTKSRSTVTSATTWLHGDRLPHTEVEPPRVLSLVSAL